MFSEAGFKAADHRDSSLVAGDVIEVRCSIGVQSRQDIAGFVRAVESGQDVIIRSTRRRRQQLRHSGDLLTKYDAGPFVDDIVRVRFEGTS